MEKKRHFFKFIPEVQNRKDRHLILADIDEDKVPHYIEIEDPRTKKIRTIQVTMQGEYLYVGNAEKEPI